MAKFNKVITQRVDYADSFYVWFNTVKNRKEKWVRCANGNREWALREVCPGRYFEDRFMSAQGFLAAILGYQSEIPWAVNGVIDGGGATADPAAGNFVAANEIGGGVSMIGGDTVGATGDTGDYTAIGWGANYPAMLRVSPHFHCTFAPILLTTAFHFAGLVDNTRPAARAAFALPDNGIFAYHDTGVDNLVHLIIRSGAVSVTDFTMAAPAGGTHAGMHIQTSDDGNFVRFIFQGTAVVPWVDVTGAAYAGLVAAQLQPYMAVGIRANNIQRELHLHDFRLIIDRGF